MRFLLTLVTLLTCCCFCSGAENADDILKASGKTQGLCVQLGGDPQLATAVHGQGKWLVVFYSPDPAKVEAAREHIESRGVYGAVTADKCLYSSLPLVANLANVVVIDSPSQGTKDGISATEVMRILCPDGVAVIKSGAEGNALVASLKAAGGADASISGAWLVVRKQRPKEYDDWTHKLYSYNKSRVSHDQAFGPPKHMQWLAGPIFPAAFPRYGTILSANGRNYYVLTPDQIMMEAYKGPTIKDELVAGMPRIEATAQYYLAARDSYNGIPLWRRLYDGTSTTIVANGDLLYAMIGGKVVVVDGRTGLITKVLGAVQFPARTELLFKDGMLVITDDKAITAIDTHREQKAWTIAKPSKADVLIEGNNVLIFNMAGKTLEGFDLRTGKERWKVDCAARIKGEGKMLFSRDDVIIFEAQTKELDWFVMGVSAKDGSLLWTYTHKFLNKTNRASIIYAGGLVWVQRWSVPGSTKTEEYDGIDPATGEVRKTYSVPRSNMYGCHPDIATDKYLMLHRPPDFLDLSNGNVTPYRATRPSCWHGATIANGLFYSAPSACHCLDAEVRGFNATVAEDKTTRAGGPRLETGPAFGQCKAYDLPSSDWPTFRHDPSRTAAVSGDKFLPRLKLLWKAQVSKPGYANATLLADDACANWTGNDGITAPTVAEGKVVVGCPDQHKLVALDAKTGAQSWSAFIGGRMDVPPTIYKGQALVGGRDGWIYAFRTSDGALAWRFRAPKDERVMVAFGQLESAWPIVGGVLVKDDLAYAVAGRSSEIDEGVTLYCLEAATGKLLWTQSPRGEDKVRFLGLADLLVADDNAVAPGGSVSFRTDLKTGALMKRDIIDGIRAGTRNGSFADYIPSTAALLDRSWHYVTAERISTRFHVQWKDGLLGQLVVFDKTRAVAFSLKKTKDSKNYEKTVKVIIAQNRTISPKPENGPLWEVMLPEGHRGEALAIVGEHVLVGTSTPDRKQGLLLVLSMKDGSQLAEYKLPGAIAAEGIAVADGSVYVSTGRGELLCFAPEK